MALEADRMANLVLSKEEFDKEIRSSWRSAAAHRGPRESLVYEQLMAAAFIASPYRAPVVGWMNDLEAMTVEDARDWYERWYAPNNALLVVVGDVCRPRSSRWPSAPTGALRRVRCRRASRRSNRCSAACGA
jgi:zinc protease